MSVIKNHWFGFFVGIFALFFTLVFILVLASPKKDIQKRGFVTCTENFVEQVSLCESGYTCLVKGIFKHGYCNVKVVLSGVKNWALGKQETPWTNYMFNPQYLENEEIDEGLQQFYHENPNLTQEMNVFKKNNKELESDGEE